MKLLQKIEFWLFSVPALIVAIGGIAHYGTWRVLWVFPICFTESASVSVSWRRLGGRSAGRRGYGAARRPPLGQDG